MESLLALKKSVSDPHKARPQMLEALLSVPPLLLEQARLDITSASFTSLSLTPVQVIEITQASAIIAFNALAAAGAIRIAPCASMVTLVSTHSGSDVSVAVELIQSHITDRKS